MAINKVIDRNGNTLIDLTNDTISADKVLQGTKFHGADGKEYTGTLPANKMDTLKYNFYDYDGTLMYSFTDDELDALTELPAGADHTEDNLTFEGWNWDLDELKSVDRTRPDRPIVGAHYITTDGKTYVTITSSPINREEVFAFGTQSGGIVIDIDWGDGTTQQYDSGGSGTINIAHTFPEPNKEYTISFNIIENIERACFGNPSQSWVSGNYQGYTVTDIKIGNISYLSCKSKINYARMEKINIPKNLKIVDTEYIFSYSRISFITMPKNIPGGAVSSITGLKCISLPNGITDLSAKSCVNLEGIYLPDGLISLNDNCFSSCYSLKNVYIPDSVTYLGSSCFYYNYSLSSVRLPNNAEGKSLPSRCFYDDSCLEYIFIPDGITLISSEAFYSNTSLKTIKISDSVNTVAKSFYNFSGTLDLTLQTKVINATTSLGLSSNAKLIILIPSDLLDAYKSASYWSNYADYMVGV